MFLTILFGISQLTSSQATTHPMFSDCSIDICSSVPTEQDQSNRSWPRYCYKCPEGEDEVIFLRKYKEENWEYVLTDNSQFEGRVMLSIHPCFKPELDSMGNLWTTWCFRNQIVMFEKIGERIWVYKQDFKGGYPLFQYRILVFSEAFLTAENQLNPYNAKPDQEKQTKIKPKQKEDKKNDTGTKEKNYEISCEHHGGFNGKVVMKNKDSANASCRDLEGDTAGRWFFVEYNEGGKIEFKKDRLGNFLLSLKGGRKTYENFLEQPPYPSRNVVPCKVLKSDGEVNFEPDLFVHGLFWQKDYENGILVSYVKATDDQDRVQGMYLVDKDTGKRVKSFNLV